MKAKNLASVLVALALAAAALPASALSVTSVSLAVSPTHGGAPCPVTFTFTGKVTLNGRGEFRYKWERSDGAVDTTGPHTAAYDGTHPAIVTETWTLGAATPAFHPFHGTVTLHVLAPNDASSKPAPFTLDCGAPPPTVVPGAAGRPTLPAGAVPHLSPAHPTFDAPVLLVPAVIPVAFGGAGGKTLPPGPCDLELRQQPGTDAILIGLLRNGQRVGETKGKFVPGGSTKMDDWEARVRRGFRFGAQSRVSFAGNAGKIGCTNEVTPGSPDPAAIEFLLPAVQK